VRKSVRSFSALIGGVAAAVALLFGGGRAHAAPADDAHKTEVRIPAGEVVLAGTLYRPAGAEGVLPVVVLSHGSGPGARAKGGDYWTNTALRAGLAVLAFDKRGAGQTTGTLPPYTVENTPELFGALASDLAHAVRWVQNQPGVDKSRIGLMGGSQAGWIMPIAASQEPLVKFIIAGEGVPVSAGIEDVHGDYIDAVNNGTERGATLRQIAPADIMGLNYDGPAGFDPTPILEKTDIPVLWIFGLYDGVIPTRQSIDAIGRLHKQGKTNHHLHIFPFGDHDFLNVMTGERYDVAAVSREWLKRVGVTK